MLLLLLCGAIQLTNGDTYNVVVGTEQHVNLVDRRFLSFTVDPKYLFDSDKYKSKECVCMASSLSPAYIRVAGPTTDRLVWRNQSISIDEEYSDEYGSSIISHRQWERFIKWARNTGFRLVFALTRSSGGQWEKTVGQVLSVGAGGGEMYWQLGYECSNQSIEEYLSDLETLRLLVESSGQGKVVGGDITPCLQANSDFKDYVTLANDRTDAIFLNGNSSSRELERMSEKDRLSLLRLLSTSSTPLWLTETDQVENELGRAADWMTSLGYSARNGFSVHYRELLEKELYEPTLSFYMALLFKNLVGERVLSVDIDASQAMIFAHCTTLRHKPVPGAITFYGVNMEEEPARFSIKLSQTEEGGDVLQFILGHDHNRNIVVNGRPMYYEGDIKPVVRRIRPYKTLLLNLPSKSFGFWVLANTKVEACQNLDDDTREKSDEVKDKVVELVKRSAGNQNFTIGSEGIVKNNELKASIDEINNDSKALRDRTMKENGNIRRVRRDVFDRVSGFHDRESVFDNLLSKINLPVGFNGDLLERINQIKEDNLERLRQKKEELSSLVKRNSRKFLKLRPKFDINNRHRRKQESYRQRRKSRKTKNKKFDEKINNKKINEEELNVEDPSTHNRERRSTLHKHTHDTNDVKSTEKVDREELHIDNILDKVKQIGEMPLKIVAGDENYDYYDEVRDGLTVKTKIQDDSAILKIEDESHSGLLKSTLHDLMRLLGDLNKQINRFWSTITIL